MTQEYGADWLTAGGIDDQPVTLRNVIFATNIEANDPTAPFLTVDIVPDDPEVTPFEGQRLGVGQNWQESDDGSEITRTDGRKPAYHTSSKAGRLLASFMEVGGRELAAARAKAGDTSTPFQAAWWEGLHGTIKMNEGSFTDRESGEKVEYTYYTFTATDGWPESNGSKGKAKASKAVAKKAPAKKAASKKAASKPDPEPEPEPEPEVAETPATEGGSELEAKVREHCAATTVDDHDTWMMEVYADIPEVADDEAIAAIVDDPAGVWADQWEAEG